MVGSLHSRLLLIPSERTDHVLCHFGGMHVGQPRRPPLLQVPVEWLVSAAASTKTVTTTSLRILRILVIRMRLAMPLHSAHSKE